VTCASVFRPTVIVFFKPFISVIFWYGPVFWWNTDRLIIGWSQQITFVIVDAQNCSLINWTFSQWLVPVCCVLLCCDILCLYNPLKATSCHYAERSGWYSMRSVHRAVWIMCCNMLQSQFFFLTLNIIHSECWAWLLTTRSSFTRHHSSDCMCFESGVTSALLVRWPKGI